MSRSLSSCDKFFLINFDATVSDRSTTSRRISCTRASGLLLNLPLGVLDQPSGLFLGFSLQVFANGLCLGPTPGHDRLGFCASLGDDLS